MKLNWLNPNCPADGVAWNFCPVGGKRHGVMVVEQNQNGGLTARCQKCYQPRKRKGGK